MRNSQLFELLEHCEWADATLWKTVLAADAAPADAAPAGGAPAEDEDDKIIGWLHHIHLVQHAFTTVWTGSPLDLENLPKPEDHDDPASICRWGRSCHRGLQGYLVECDEVDLARELTFPWAAQMEEAWQHPLQPVTLQQSVHQVAMHSAHHRAQVSSELRRLGGEPPAIDYIVWLWRGRPEPEWP